MIASVDAWIIYIERGEPSVSNDAYGSHDL